MFCFQLAHCIKFNFQSKPELFSIFCKCTNHTYNLQFTMISLLDLFFVFISTACVNEYACVLLQSCSLSRNISSCSSLSALAACQIELWSLNSPCTKRFLIYMPVSTPKDAATQYLPMCQHKGIATVWVRDKELSFKFTCC